MPTTPLREMTHLMYHVLDLLESLVPVVCGISMEGKNPPRVPWGLHLKHPKESGSWEWSSWVVCRKWTGMSFNLSLGKSKLQDQVTSLLSPAFPQCSHCASSVFTTGPSGPRGFLSLSSLADAHGSFTPQVTCHPPRTPSS